MEALIQFITKNLLALWPIARVYGWEQGLLVRGGRPIVTLSPGLHWRWWFVDEVMLCTSVERTIELCPGCITTLDGRVVTVSANLSYVVTDVWKLWMKVSGTDSSIRNLASGIAATAVSGRSWDEIARGRAGFNDELLGLMDAALRDWGVTVTRIQLIDLAPARAIRLVQDNHNASR